MKKEPMQLKIFHLSHPCQQTEWPSLMGDKYLHTLPFPWEIVSDIESANVVVWDGVISPKMRPVVESVMADLKNEKVLLLMGDSYTLLKDDPMVEFVHLDGPLSVEVPGMCALPEDILIALDLCYQKLNHV